MIKYEVSFIYNYDPRVWKSVLYKVCNDSKGIIHSITFFSNKIILSLFPKYSKYIILVNFLNLFSFLTLFVSFCLRIM